MVQGEKWTTRTRASEWIRTGSTVTTKANGKRTAGGGWGGPGGLGCFSGLAVSEVKQKKLRWARGDLKRKGGSDNTPSDSSDNIGSSEKGAVVKAQHARAMPHI